MNMLRLRGDVMKAARFAGLPDAEKARVLLLADVMTRVATASKPRAQLALEAQKLTHLPGCSEKRLEARYYALRAGKPWYEVLVDGRCDPVRIDLPVAVQELFKTYMERHQRGRLRAAHRKLLEDLRKGELFDGVGTWRDLFAADHPHTPLPPTCPRSYEPKGWTYSNFMRHKPSQFALTAAHQGRASAALYRPKVYTSRVGMSVGEKYVFDDVWHDNYVNFIGVSNVAIRPLELSAIDLFSGSKFAWGLKPLLEKDDERGREAIRKRHMLFFLAHILCNIGYRPEGTELVVERGTATIFPDLEAQLADWSDKAITVNRSGVTTNPAFAGLFRGISKGNPRFKASLESLHNLLHNELALVAGQAGRNPEEAPEELAALLKHNNALLMALHALPQEKRDQLRFPLLEWNQFGAIVKEVYDTIDSRTWHDIEGYEESGLVMPQFMLAEGLDWLDITAMDRVNPAERAAVEAIIRLPGRTRVRKLSPREVWNRGQHRLVKLPPHIAPLILGPENGTERTVGKDHLITFEDRELGPGLHRYDAELIDLRGRREQLQPGQSYLIHIVPFDPSRIFLSAADGSVLGWCQRWDRATHVDIDSIARAMGAARKKEADLLAPVAARGKQITKQRLEDARHNIGVLGGSNEAAAITEAAESVTVRKADRDAATGRDAEEPAQEFSSEEIAHLLKDE